MSKEAAPQKAPALQGYLLALSSGLRFAAEVAVRDARGALAARRSARRPPRTQAARVLILLRWLRRCDRPGPSFGSTTSRMTPWPWRFRLAN